MLTFPDPEYQENRMADGISTERLHLQDGDIVIVTVPEGSVTAETLNGMASAAAERFEGHRVVVVAGDMRVFSASLLGAKEAAELLGIRVENMKREALEPLTYISGGRIPVYLRADVEAKAEQRARRAEASEA